MALGVGRSLAAVTKMAAGGRDAGMGARVCACVRARRFTFDHSGRAHRRESGARGGARGPRGATSMKLCQHMRKRGAHSSRALSGFFVPFFAYQ